MKKITVMIPLCTGICLSLCGCGNLTIFDSNDGGDAETTAAQIETTEASDKNKTSADDTANSTETSVTADAAGSETSVKKEITELTLIAAGDNLIHDTVYEKFYEGDGEYDFRPLYMYVKDLIQSYDLAVINQETIFVEDDSEISNYPDFGTPHEMGDAITDTGFDVVLSATNHTMDKGADTVEYMYDYWNTKYPEVTLLGIHGDEEDFNTIDIVEKNGIKLAMFNYTYGLNGRELPVGREYLVDLLWNEDKFLSDIEKAESKADMTVCFLHIGDEYVYEPTEYHKNYVESVIDAGADLVICAHPHVVEPYGEITTANGNKGIVFYSCGNFVSGQDEIDRLLGGMASVKITKTKEGDKTETRVTDYDFIPVVTHYSEWTEAVYELEDYTDDLADLHLIKLYDDRFTVDHLWELWEYITGKNLY